MFQAGIDWSDHVNTCWAHYISWGSETCNRGDQTWSDMEPPKVSSQSLTDTIQYWKLYKSQLRIIDISQIQ